MTEIMEAHRKQDGTLGGIPPHKRNGPKGMMPSTWTGRSIRVQYRGGDGRAQDMSGRLLDTYPAGLVVGTNGTRTLVAWDSLVIVELADG